MIKKGQLEYFGNSFSSMAEALMTDDEKEELSDDLSVSSISQDPETGEIETRYEPYEGPTLSPIEVLDDLAEISHFNGSSPEIIRRNRLLGARAVSAALYALSKEDDNLFAEPGSLPKADEDLYRRNLFSIQRDLRIITSKMKDSVANDEVPQEFLSQLSLMDWVLQPYPVPGDPAPKPEQ